MARIDPENFQEAWDEIKGEWGKPPSGVTAIFPVESAVMQTLLAEENDDNGTSKTHTERIHRMVDHIANRNGTRNMYEPLEFQRIGDEEFMLENMGSELWLEIADDEVRSRRADQVDEKASESSSEKETGRGQPRSASRPGS